MVTLTVALPCWHSTQYVQNSNPHITPLSPLQCIAYTCLCTIHLRSKATLAGTLRWSTIPPQWACVQEATYAPKKVRSPSLQHAASASPTLTTASFRAQIKSVLLNAGACTPFGTHATTHHARPVLPTTGRPDLHAVALASGASISTTMHWSPLHQAIVSSV